MERNKTSHKTDNSTGLMSVDKQHIIALSILFALPVILFHSTILGGKQFMAHDTIQWRAGAESTFEYRAEHDGEEPLWATNMFGGMPSYTVYVFKAVPHLDNKVFDQLRMIWPAIPYWVLLGGAYFLFILMGFRPFTSVLGAIFIGFSAYIPIIIGAGHNIKFIAYSYIPWMFSGYWLITRTDKHWWGFFLFAVACTLHFRAGHPQVTYYFLYVFAALFLYDAWKYYKEKNTATLGKITALLAIAAGLGFLGTTDQYLRLLEYYPHSIRGGSAIAETSATGGLTIQYAFTWSQGLLETFTLIIPNLFGGDSSLAYWGEKPGTSGPHYFGAIAFLLFLIGIFRSPRKLKYLFLGAGILTLTFSWGHHFASNLLWFQILPGFDKFRTPEMWLIATVFCFSVIAVFGMETILNRANEGKDGLKKLYKPMAIAAGLGLIFLVAGNFIFPFESERERQQMALQLSRQHDLTPDNPRIHQHINQVFANQYKPERRELARKDIIRYLLLISVGCLMITLYYRSKISGDHLVLSLILFASVDMLTVGSRYINDDALVDRNLELTGVIESLGTPADTFIRQNKKSPDSYSYRALPLSDHPFENAIPSYFYPSLGGYSGAKLSLIQDVIDEGLFTGREGINKAVLDMLNVKYISAQRQLPLENFREVYNNNGYFVHENENVLPKAWFVDEIIQVSNPLEAFDMILPGQGFDPRGTAVTESMNVIEIQEDPDAEIEIVSYSGEKIVINTRRSQPGFLVLSEIYYPPGWTATLDGEVIPIHKTNYLLRGFEIPAGESTLELSFKPASHIWGSRISWASNVTQWLIGIGLIIGWWKRKQTGGHDEN